jgi:predicted lipoprotein
MRTMIFLVSALAMAAAAAAEPDYRAINADAVRRHVLPRYTALAEASAALEAATRSHCADPAALREPWRRAMAAWQGAQHLRFGPIEYFNRAQRFAFWPDPRNVVQRQLAELFERRDPAALDPDKLVTGSVATQGLTALERVLFDPAESGHLKDDAFRCRWLAAVGANLAAMARDTLAEWSKPPQHFAERFVRADGDGSQYHAPSEATLELFKGVYAAVELVADHKLARPMGDKAAAARPRLAESWRSESSLANVRINLAAARELYASLERGVGDAALRAEIARRFAAAVATAEEVKGPLETAVADPARRPAVEKLRREAAALKRLLADRLAPALGLPLGFNALDGD